ncbi:tellurite resistance TerB family protein [bacterium]|nr:tellurite resistance TerB family protein [bacterium]
MDPVKLLGSLLGRNATGGNMLGSLLGGGGGGAGGMLGSLLGGGGAAAGGGGLGGMLGGLLGGGAAAGAGGLGGMLGGLLGGGGAAEAAPEPAAASAAPAADQATLMIRAMCNAAKADGQVDAQEQENIIGKLGDDVGQAEIDFLKSELAKPLDAAGFASSVPADMAQSVYALSVMTVKVDTPQEAQYLQQLAQGLNLGNDVLAGIHKQLGLA